MHSSTRIRAVYRTHIHTHMLFLRTLCVCDFRGGASIKNGGRQRDVTIIFKHGSIGVGNSPQLICERLHMHELPNLQAPAPGCKSWAASPLMTCHHKTENSEMSCDFKIYPYIFEPTDILTVNTYIKKNLLITKRHLKWYRTLKRVTESCFKITSNHPSAPLATTNAITSTGAINDTITETAY